VKADTETCLEKFIGTIGADLLLKMQIDAIPDRTPPSAAADGAYWLFYYATFQNQIPGFRLQVSIWCKGGLNGCGE
jgi:hypothetical protein